MTIFFFLISAFEFKRFHVFVNLSLQLVTIIMVFWNINDLLLEQVAALLSGAIAYMIINLIYKLHISNF